MRIIGKDVMVKDEAKSHYQEEEYNAEVLEIKNESNQDGVHVVLVLLKKDGKIKTEPVSRCTLIKKEGGLNEST